MRHHGLQKQVSLYVSLSDWKALHDEAQRQKLPITELVRNWIGPHVAQLPKPVPAVGTDST